MKSRRQASAPPLPNKKRPTRTCTLNQPQDQLYRTAATGERNKVFIAEPPKQRSRRLNGGLRTVGAGKMRFSLRSAGILQDHAYTMDGYTTKKKDRHVSMSVLKRRLPTLPRENRSTIGASELNFSVRNGKRWNLTAITT